MKHQFSRNELAIGTEGLELLNSKTVLILGVGGVGTFAAESMSRSGIGHIILVDKDDVDITNVNRQIHATTKTIGQSKVALMESRIKDINPNCVVTCFHKFYNEETYDEILNNNIDYIIDASDTIEYKMHIIREALKRDIKIISSMGAANKSDPTRFQIVDIRKTHTDPIAKVIRNQFKKERLKGKVPVVFSDESPIVAKPEVVERLGDSTSSIRKAQNPPTSNAFTPSVAGLVAASWVYNDILKDIEILRVKDKGTFKR